MATYIVLITETEQGEKNIVDSVNRANQFNEVAAEFGVTVKGMYWTMGKFDGLVIIDAPDAESAHSLMYKLMSHGAVRTQIMQAFDAEETKAILARATA